MEKDGMNKPEREHVYLYWLLQLPAMGAVLGAMLLLQSKLDPVKQAQRAAVQTANARPQSAPVLKEGR